MSKKQVKWWFFVALFIVLSHIGIRGCDSGDVTNRSSKNVANNQIEQARQLITGEENAQEGNVKEKSTYVSSRLDSFAGFTFGDKFNTNSYGEYKYRETIKEIFYKMSENSRMHIDCVDKAYKLHYPKIQLPGIENQYILITPNTHKIFGVILKSDSDENKRFSEWSYLLERKYGYSEMVSYEYPSPINNEKMYQFKNGKMFLQTRTIGGAFLIVVNTDLYELAKKEYREALNSADVSGL